MSQRFRRPGGNGRIGQPKPRRAQQPDPTRDYTDDLRAEALELVAKVRTGHAGLCDVAEFIARGERARQIWSVHGRTIQLVHSETSQ